MSLIIRDILRQSQKMHDPARFALDQAEQKENNDYTNRLGFPTYWNRSVSQRLSTGSPQDIRHILPPAGPDISGSVAMLAIAVSLTFAISATLALGVIVLTLRQQAPSIVAVIAQARASQREREIVFTSPHEAKALAAAFEPVVRPRRVAGGTVSPQSSKRRPASPFFAGSLCAAA